MLGKQRKCTTCTPNNKRAWGCEKDIREFDFFGEKLTRCPLRMVLDEPELLSDVTKHYRWYEKDQFPAQGTWYDQSPIWIELMEAVRAGHQEADAYEQDKQARRAREAEELKASGGRGTGRTNGPTHA